MYGQRNIKTTFAGKLQVQSYYSKRTEVLVLSVGHIKKKYSRIPLIRKLVIRIPYYLDRLGPSDKFIKNFTNFTKLIN